MISGTPNIVAPSTEKHTFYVSFFFSPNYPISYLDLLRGIIIYAYNPHTQKDKNACIQYLSFLSLYPVHYLYNIILVSLFFSLRSYSLSVQHTCNIHSLSQSSFSLFVPLVYSIIALI